MFSSSVLNLDPTAETHRIVEAIRAQVLGTLRRRGAVVGLSGGVDSSVVAALSVRALGKDKVLGLFMPEHHSSGDSLRLGRMLAESLGITA
ncbi:MAG TPA: NAD(+) synthase, partial [Polyangia bacterium]|nr:NAD(+) synthase [Polyangia bacterium]